MNPASAAYPNVRPDALSPSPHSNQYGRESPVSHTGALRPTASGESTSFKQPFTGPGVSADGHAARLGRTLSSPADSSNDFNTEEFGGWDGAGESDDLEGHTIDAAGLLETSLDLDQWEYLR